MPLSSLEKDVCAALGERAANMEADLERYVAIPTGHNHAPGLDEFRKDVTDRCRALRASVEYADGDPKPDWLLGASSGKPPVTAVCRAPSGAKGARILLSGHLDTVFPPPPRGSFLKMTRTPGSPRKAVGPGVVDMKGGIVIALHALEAFAELDVRLAWTYVFNSDEETGSYHSERALRAEAKKHDVAFATEPALLDGSIVTERLGSGQFMIEARGKSAHVGRDFASGVNAAVALSRAVAATGDMADAAAGRIISVGVLEAADATNIVPDLARAWGNARYPDEEVSEDIQRRLVALETSPDAMPSLTVHRSFNRPAKPRTEGVARLASIIRDAGADMGLTIGEGKTGGVSDGNILQSEGLPTIDTMGVRGGGLHTTSEWIELDSLLERSQLLALSMLRVSSAW
ncbi:MAG: M20/M25/M40 family metallo-hydrolase [Phycisphaerales bacterium]